MDNDGWQVSGDKKKKNLCLKRINLFVHQDYIHNLSDDDQGWNQSDKRANNPYIIDLKLEYDDQIQIPQYKIPSIFQSQEQHLPEQFEDKADQDSISKFLRTFNNMVPFLILRYEEKGQVKYIKFEEIKDHKELYHPYIDLFLYYNYKTNDLNVIQQELDKLLSPKQSTREDYLKQKNCLKFAAKKSKSWQSDGQENTLLKSFIDVEQNDDFQDLQKSGISSHMQQSQIQNQNKPAGQQSRKDSESQDSNQLTNSSIQGQKKKKKKNKPKQEDNSTQLDQSFISQNNPQLNQSQINNNSQKNAPNNNSPQKTPQIQNSPQKSPQTKKSPQKNTQNFDESQNDDQQGQSISSVKQNTQNPKISLGLFLILLIGLIVFLDWSGLVNSGQLQNQNIIVISKDKTNSNNKPNDNNINKPNDNNINNPNNNNNNKPNDNINKPKDNNINKPNDNNNNKPNENNNNKPNNNNNNKPNLDNNNNKPNDNNNNKPNDNNNNKPNLDNNNIKPNVDNNKPNLDSSKNPDNKQNLDNSKNPDNQPKDKGLIDRQRLVEIQNLAQENLNKIHEQISLRLKTNSIDNIQDQYTLVKQGIIRDTEKIIQDAINFIKDNEMFKKQKKFNDNSVDDTVVSLENALRDNEAKIGLHISNRDQSLKQDIEIRKNSDDIYVDYLQSIHKNLINSFKTLKTSTNSGSLDFLQQISSLEVK